jgi:hypothetical protein
MHVMTWRAPSIGLYLLRRVGRVHGERPAAAAAQGTPPSPAAPMPPLTPPAAPAKLATPSAIVCTQGQMNDTRLCGRSWLGQPRTHSRQRIGHENQNVASCAYLVGGQTQTGIPDPRERLARCQKITFP